ncbi:GtrA family protein [Microbacterium sp. VKM Ac-2870]|nr:GtrA family protein [Microbacterium sp. VKM Ac-2870]
MKDTAGRIVRDHRFRFLLVGGINTAFGFLVFVVLDLTLGRALDNAGLRVVASIATLLIAHAIASLLAFALYRRFVFRVTGNVLIDFLRFESVYAVPLAINILVLPVLVAVGIPRIAAQGCIIVVTTLFSYFGHRFFSFRRADASEPARDPLAEAFAHDRREAASNAPSEDGR